MGLYTISYLGAYKHISIGVFLDVGMVVQRLIFLAVGRGAPSPLTTVLLWGSRLSVGLINIIFRLGWCTYIEVDKMTV